MNQSHLRTDSHQAEVGAKDQITSKKDQMINGKHQRKCLLSRSRSLGVNTALDSLRIQF